MKVVLNLSGINFHFLLYFISVFTLPKIISELKIFFLLLFSFCFFGSPAQKSSVVPDKPKLVVGIVVDQMRYDFLYRYESKYSEGGFKRLMNQGTNCKNVQYNYFPTYTGPGHACIYTGSVPAINGIVSNDWYDRTTGTMVYVTSDNNYKTIGAEDLSGNMSPQKMLTTTVTDQLRLSNNFKSKVIGISLKDRGAILPAGHSANAAYWLDGQSGNWVTSSYYMNDLPLWVKNVNAQQLAKKNLSQPWETLLPIEQYTESTSDSNSYESVLPSDKKTTFPHRLSDSTWVKFDLVKYTPFGNTMLKDFAKEAIQSENLGKSSVTDFITISFSATDYVGHTFGPNSIESEDTYLRLDKDLSDLFSFLDSWLGKNNYLIFLTADHGVSPVPAFASEHKIPAGVIYESALLDSMKKILNSVYGDTGLILSYSNQQLYLNHDLMRTKKITTTDVLAQLIPFLNTQKGIYDEFDISKLNETTIPASIKNILGNSFNPKRSGDIMLLYEPYWFGGFRERGTTHGAVYSYDTHVPLLWYGWKVKSGDDNSLHHITDISPTISNILNIQEPNGSIGEVIELTK